MIQAALYVLSAFLALTGLRVFAQVQPHLDAPAVSAPQGNGWQFFASSALTSFAAIAYAWITRDSNEQKRIADQLREEIKRVREEGEREKKRCADEAAREAAEMLAHLEDRTRERDEARAEVRALAKERDSWMKKAYGQGWRSSDEIPTRKDPP